MAKLLLLDFHFNQAEVEPVAFPTLRCSALLCAAQRQRRVNITGPQKNKTSHTDQGKRRTTEERGLFPLISRIMEYIVHLSLMSDTYIAPPAWVMMAILISVTV